MKTSDNGLFQLEILQDDNGFDEITLTRVRDFTAEELQHPLQTSILKWEFLEQFLTELDQTEYYFMHLHGLDTCALCAVYFVDVDDDLNPVNCSGCPIFAKTGLKYCQDTPNDEIEDDTSREAGELLELVTEELQLLRSLE